MTMRARTEPAAGWSFREVSSWIRYPSSWEQVDITAVAVDREDHVVVFRRGPHPVAILDRSGHVVASWGDGDFINPHALSIAADGTIVCTDSGGHTVSRYTSEGELLDRIESHASRASYEGVDPILPWTVRGAGPPFNFPTAAVQDAERRLFVSDGYGNASLHRFGPTGELEATWGGRGIWAGRFDIPHGVTLGPDGLLYVSDRLNGRVQILDSEGQPQGEWPAALPNSVDFDAEGFAYVVELGGTVTWATQPTLRWPLPRVTIRDGQGVVLCALHDGAEAESAGFTAPHDVAVDSAGTVYVAEVPFTFYRGEPPKGALALRRFERIN